MVLNAWLLGQGWRASAQPPCLSTSRPPKVNDLAVCRGKASLPVAWVGVSGAQPEWPSEITSLSLVREEVSVEQAALLGDFSPKMVTLPFY